MQSLQAGHQLSLDPLSTPFRVAVIVRCLDEKFSAWCFWGMLTMALLAKQIVTLNPFTTVRAIRFSG
jgi:hypothetical protein